MTGVSMKEIYTVTEINEHIREIFYEDSVLGKNVYVRGEVSNCKYHNSGHIYFSIKDAGGSLACVLFKGQRKGLLFPLKDGQQVLVLGGISVYEQRGSYQMYAKEILLDGAGRLYEKFEQLKRELAGMGMFAEEYKKPIPAYSRTIGVVTAPDGAAVQDIRKIAFRRNPYVQLILYPAQVQGEGAAQSIARGIRALDAYGVDVMIVGRGGGSMEDLWAFNEEIVARAIFACQTPVISAVGHETDTTISDYVADLRVSTPSAAAERAVADIREVLERMRACKSSMERWMEFQLRQKRAFLERCQIQLYHASPRQQLYEKRMRASDLEMRLETVMSQILTKDRGLLSLYAERLEGLSPLKKLSQGYSYVTDEKGGCVTSVKQVQKGCLLEIQVLDGKIKTQVQDMAQEGDFR